MSQNSSFNLIFLKKRPENVGPDAGSQKNPYMTEIVRSLRTIFVSLNKGTPSIDAHGARAPSVQGSNSLLYIRLRRCRCANNEHHHLLQHHERQ